MVPHYTFPNRLSHLRETVIEYPWIGLLYAGIRAPNLIQDKFQGQPTPDFWILE